MINITLAVSSPNNRGIHNVAKNLKKLGDINSRASLFIPKIRRTHLNFINRVIWELKHTNLKNKTVQDIYISVYSRLPPFPTLRILFEELKSCCAFCQLGDFTILLNLIEKFSKPGISLLLWDIIINKF